MINEFIINENYKDFNPLLFGSENCMPNWSFGPTKREYWLLHYVVSGKGIFRRENTTYNIKAGDIFVIPPYIETYYQADKEKPWHYIWVGFTTSNEKLLKPFLYPIIKCNNAGEIFITMLDCLNMENGKSAFLSSCIFKLYSALLETNDKSSNDYVDKALNYIHAEYMKKISVNEIAGLLNLNRSYLTVLFKNKIGDTPGQYILNYRLQKAANLMLTHGETPSNVAIYCGFSDLYSFSKAFKKKFGCSPKNYKKNNEINPKLSVD